MEPAVARGLGCQRQTLAESDSRRKSQEGGSQIFKPPVEKKKNHLQNYVDSPLCRERQLISCSKAGSWVKRGRCWGFDHIVEGGLAPEGNPVCPPFLSRNSYWLATSARSPARLASRRWKVCPGPSLPSLRCCRRLLRHLQTAWSEIKAQKNQSVSIKNVIFSYTDFKHPCWLAEFRMIRTSDICGTVFGWG